MTRSYPVPSDSTMPPLVRMSRISGGKSLHQNEKMRGFDARRGWRVVKVGLDGSDARSPPRGVVVAWRLLILYMEDINSITFHKRSARFATVPHRGNHAFRSCFKRLPELRRLFDGATLLAQTSRFPRISAVVHFPVRKPYASSSKISTLVRFLSPVRNFLARC